MCKFAKSQMKKIYQGRNEVQKVSWTTNFNILVVSQNFQLSAQKWEQKLNYHFDHDHNY